MSAVTGILAGVVAVAGAVTLYRFAERPVAAFRDLIDENAGKKSPGPVIDFERDPDTGTFRPR